MKIDITRTWTKAALLDHLGSLDSGAALEFVRPPKAKTRECWCGCGGETKGGKFIPGHDSKFHSLAKQITRGLSTVTQDDIEETLPCQEAIDDLRHHIALELPLHQAREKAKAAIKATKAATKLAKAETSEILESEVPGETSDSEVDDLLASMM